MARVGISGVLATLLDVLSLLILVECLSVPVVLAAFLAASIGAVSSFLVNKHWAFRDATPLRLSQIGSFVGVALGSAIGVAAGIQVFAVMIGLPYLIAKAIAAVLIFVFWSFPVQRRLVFRTRAAA